MNNKKAEPPSCLTPQRFMIGQDSRGNWVVQDQNGVRGGLFVNRAEALRYIRFENGDQPQALVMVSGALELDMSRKLMTAPRYAEIPPPERRVA